MADELYQEYEKVRQEVQRLKRLLDKSEMYMYHRLMCDWELTHNMPCSCGVVQLDREIREALRDDYRPVDSGE